jgi:hypothetical protein
MTRASACSSGSMTILPNGGVSVSNCVRGIRSWGLPATLPSSSPRTPDGRPHDRLGPAGQVATRHTTDLGRSSREDSPLRALPEAVRAGYRSTGGTAFGPEPGRVAPHIFHDHEIVDCWRRPGTWTTGSIRPATYETLFGLMASTGLRVSEAFTCAMPMSTSSVGC